jgi:hypothetical protein
MASQSIASVSPLIGDGGLAKRRAHPEVARVITTGHVALGQPPHADDESSGMWNEGGQYGN